MLLILPPSGKLIIEDQVSERIAYARPKREKLSRTEKQGAYKQQVEPDTKNKLHGNEKQAH